MTDPGARAGALPLFMSAGAGAFAALGQAPVSLSPFTLMGLVLAVHLFAGTPSPRRAALIGWAFGAGYFALALNWIVEPFLVDVPRHGWMAPFALVFMAGGLALFWGLAFGLARWLSRAAWPLIPTLAGAEILRAKLFTGFPWAMPSQVLVDGAAGQLAAFLGPHGLNLLLFFAAWAIARAPRLGAYALALGVVVAMLWPLPPAMSPDEDRPLIRLVQPNAPQHLKWDPDHAPRFLARALESTRPGAQPPDLVIWPETSVPSELSAAGETLARIAEAAGGVPVVLGLQRGEGYRYYNSAILLGAQGQIADTYDKHHLVPFGEYMPFGGLMSRLGLYGLAADEGFGFSPGPGPRLMDLGELGTALPLICYEVVFPRDVRGAPERPEFLMQLTNDAWFGRFSGPYQHLAQARMRAIEQGLPLVRAANTGVSAVIDARGRILTSLDLGEGGHVEARLPVPHAPTLYARVGDLPLSIVLLLLHLALIARRFAKSD
ncbi:apolipoprotein N-acyltransferase [Salinihabitans flavidus]|uniref:Apolipoprotein N-acyltransferase n=1 Tax=Salinihabitans flavidus TaxID=569882 RepID=A0A1H8NYM1_9RHOB|nr:apolipoprotein N-acyltransferase [Salinihabitans flavidus]SEO34729.1 apolipoprotein N-acyltransferase [Salinihabitans flavidus]